ncbi:MAG: hypothetical protein QOG62_675 [Thermoleophilaceae bacterium]|nr:hypothetical protein [Thermoleophilaceae bacterium]
MFSAGDIVRRSIAPCCCRGTVRGLMISSYVELLAD